MDLSTVKLENDMDLGDAVSNIYGELPNLDQPMLSSPNGTEGLLSMEIDDVHGFASYSDHSSHNSPSPLDDDFSSASPPEPTVFQNPKDELEPISFWNKLSPPTEVNNFLDEMPLSTPQKSSPPVQTAQSEPSVSQRVQSIMKRQSHSKKSKRSKGGSAKHSPRNQEVALTVKPTPTKQKPSQARRGKGSSSRKRKLTDELNSSTSLAHNTHTIKALSAEAKNENLTEDERKELKRQQRLMRNRVSAQLSRERKKAYLTNLETQLQDLASSNKSMSEQLEKLQMENELLKKKLEAYEQSDNSSYGSAEDSPMFYPFKNADGSTHPRSKKHKNMRSTARTGAVLLAIVFSFGVFYHIVGVDNASGNPLRIPANGDLPATVFKGRSLQGLDLASERAALPSPDVIKSKLKNKALAIAAEKAADKSSDAEDRAIYLEAQQMQQLTRQLQEKMLSEGMLQDGIPRNNDSAVPGKTLPPISINGVDSKGLDMYKANQPDIHQALANAIFMYQKMLDKSNSTDDVMPASIMFCPSAVHIAPMKGSQAGAVVQKGNVPSKPVDANNMLLWVPSSSLSTTFGPLADQNTSDKAPPASGAVTELAVKISAVQPVLS